ncbi:hypothetical protein COCMIDRAFT_5182 [Bipolaris oryzae ATCC 44560]|uniref:Amidase domain-containing protein n=1 Tax=Bipolaris oryzae ATCC 44560 TaxID=930090 RepID=W6Z789_COCMI|nr:uncharacterized protein COCMIDRAFT_5182 [Bipolaris oryzae ATCC 44560]EUC45653.1 hypothetical protein COCMIDRAFT_5182 [Bipolaris oryzae ATCC 44560]
MPKCKGITLEEATIDQLQEYLNAGTITSVHLLRCCLDRIHQVDKYISSIMELNPDAEKIAIALDAERTAGHVRGPLHGIPYIVKDNIATKDRMETTAGSWMLMGSVVPRDAHVVAKLREAGALLMGKATMSEWADMRSNNYSEGYSARGGQARSPYNLTVNPGGSSTGSAAAVAANIVTFSLGKLKSSKIHLRSNIDTPPGTETDGSVINPAERNSLVGIKPTVGLTSRAGVIPESIHQDTIGTFARTVRDATYALDAIYGIDPHDNYTSAQEGKTPKAGYTSFLSNASALSTATFGLPWNTFWIHTPPSQKPHLLSLLTLLRSSGATILNTTELPHYRTIISPSGWNWDYGTTRGFPNESEYTVVKTDFYNNIRTYLSSLENTSIRSLEDIVAYNYANDGTEGGHAWPGGIPAFFSGQDGFLASLETRGVMDETYYQALSFIQRTTREEGIDAALTHEGRKIDALLVPADVGQTYQVAAQAGYPMVTVPVGVGEETGMPFGLGIMGGAWSEGKLVRWASAIEDLMRGEGGREDMGRTVPRWFGYLERNVPVRNL